MVNFRNDGFSKKVEDSFQFLEEIKKTKCPNCQKTTLDPIIAEKGKKLLRKGGWEVRVQCKTCKTRAIFNDTGFHIGGVQEGGQ